ncbi:MULTISPECIES: Rnf-Nqr domain containing protein [unclassified Pseudomonas]|uniref:Rnf-Nqr domain containing protein n=1 Tax=unclassified Pseudomonas TaxID=196821 RepID=UPI00244AC172|nr:MULTISPECIES: Rnf-Nqr domain containing protein [unclassified Pseudomonas]MDG9923644.1 NADH:quinone oxidoreductase [Pseudomonas sp. GD04045]MDH0036406.1 NADH:quinone oxidoreductase [Pseudomonas sp. GD04019]
MKPALRLLAFAPLLGCTDLLIKGIAIGLGGLLLIALCNLLQAPLRRHLREHGRLLATLLIGAVLVGGLELLLQTLSAELAAALALHLPLLLLPCLTLALDEQPQARNGLQLGLGFALFAVLLGSLREALGHGSLLAHADWLLGPGFSGWHWSPVLPLLTQAAGGFILLGLLFALFRHFDQDDAR